MMTANLSKRLLSFAICLALIAAMALTMSSCGNNNATTNDTTGSDAVTEVATVKFDFKVVDADGNETDFEIETTEKTVGAALLAKGLIAGDESEYGLYVKEVNGITADYNTDGTYWAFYINGEYATTGVDSTEVVPGSVYTFKVEK